MRAISAQPGRTFNPKQSRQTPPPRSCSRPVNPFLRAGLPLLLTALIAVCPAPAGLAPSAWLYFAVFAGVIAALITEPLPAAACGLAGIVVLAVSGLPFTATQRAGAGFNLPAESARWALAGFSNTTVWLIFAAFVFAMGYEKTGLGRRVALLLVRQLGGRTLGLGYAIALSDLAIAPFTPSNSARSAGMIFPIVRSIPPLYDSHPGESARRIGSYLMWVAFATTCVTSSMFVTALAPNLLALDLIKKGTGVEVTWAEWFFGFLPIGGPLFLALPALIYLLYPPAVRRSADVPAWAGAELTRMGRVSRPEITMAALALLALGGWIFGGRFIDATTVALAAITLMLIFRIVSWEEILANKAAWNVLAWFATLVVLADGLNRVGFIGWVGTRVAAAMVGYSPLAVMVLLVALFFAIHYLFASLTAHTTAVLPVVLAAGMAVPDLPVRAFALLLAFSLGLMGVITPYATGPAPVYFGSGYIARKDFWRLGLIFGAIFLAVLLGIGGLTLR